MIRSFTAAFRRTGTWMRWLLAAMILATALHWLQLLLRLPVLHQLKDWFYGMHFRVVDPSYIAAAALVLVVAAYAVWFQLETRRALVVLLLSGAALQFSFGFARGPGLDGIRDMMVSTGHAQFAAVACEQPSMWALALDYESKAQTGELGTFAPSKPPGTLLFYMVWERFFNIGSGDTSAALRLERFRSGAAIAWPLFSCLVLLPLYFLGRAVCNERCALAACAVYITVPSVNLIALHLDQVLYPLLAVLCVLLAVVSAKRNSVALGLLSGATLYTAGYFSFGLLPVLILQAAMIAVFIPAASAARVKRILLLLACLAAGALLMDAVMRFATGYDILQRYSAATHYHAQWKQWQGGFTELRRVSLTNLVEFAVWIGMPLVVAGAANAGGLFTRSAWFTSRRPVTALTSGIILCVFVLLLFGRTKAETARLWMFLIPFLCIAAASLFHRNGDQDSKEPSIGLLLVLLLEFGTTVLLLRHQDFR